MKSYRLTLKAANLCRIGIIVENWKDNSFVELANLLSQNKDTIINDWSRRVLGDEEIPSAKKLSRPVFLDEIPQLLNTIAKILRNFNTSIDSTEEAGDAIGMQNSVLEHTISRMAAFYTVKEAVLEFGHLRRAVFEIISCPTMNQNRDALNLIDSGLEKSTLAYIDAVSLEREVHLNKLIVIKNKALEDAASSDKSKIMFIANMSHELRTPLNVILGFSELMNGKMISDKEKAEYSKVVSRNGYDLIKLIDDILDLAKIEIGHFEIHLQFFSITRLFAEIYEIISARIDSSKVSISFETSKHFPVSIETDSKLLKQILLNIIGNAIKFTHEGSINVLAYIKDSELRITVEDSGIGIPTSSQDKIFDSFNQADNSMTRKHGGAGLGLAISRKFAEKLNGRIVLLDRGQEKGAKFLITIPMSLTDWMFKNETKGGYIPKNKSSSFDNAELLDLKILLAEDSPDTLFLMSAWLESHGALVDKAENGLQALNLAYSNSYDVILMDIQMPVMDGYEATKQLRARGYKRPIIAVTAHAMPIDKELSLKAGCDFHMTKPVKEMKLIETIALYAAIPKEIENITL